MFKLLMFSCLPFSLLFLPPAEAQDQLEIIEEGQPVQLPVLAVTNVSTTVSVPDGGVVLIGGGIKFRTDVMQQLTAKELLKLPNANKNNRVCRTRRGNGFTSYNVLHDLQPIDFTVRGEKIEIQITRTFTRANIDQLSQHHPDISMHMTSFPKTSDGQPIEINLAIDSVYQFEDDEDLRDQEPELYAIFQKYVTPDRKIKITVTPRIIIQEEEEATQVGINEQEDK